MDNKSAFNVEKYNENIRKVIPYYDAIYDQIFSLISTHCTGRKISLLDTGCGTGILGLRALRELDLAEIVLCDPSEKMLSEAKELLGSGVCRFRAVGSEELDYENRFDVVTAIQSHHYFGRATREKAVANCFRALKKGGIFICFENTAPLTEEGRDILIERLEAYELKAGRTPEEVKHHTARYGTEFFPMNILEHLDLLKKTGFAAAELLWSSYMQSGFYAIKK